MPREKVQGDKGSTKYPGEKEKAIAYLKADPDAKGKKIKDRLGLNASSSLINTWLRDHKSKPQSQENTPEESWNQPKYRESSNQKLFCSFCGKCQDEVSKLVAGPAVYICDECIFLCSDIIEETSDEEFLEKHKADDFIRNMRHIKNRSDTAFNNTCAYIKGVADCLDRF